MAREKRNIEPGFPHHITQRSNNGIKVFLDDEDHLSFLGIFRKNFEKWNIQILAYCLMPNHFHFLLIPPDQESLSMAIGRSSRAYAIYFNRKYNRKNHLWGTRFFSSVITDDLYLFACAAYIDSNPVRARMVNDADQYFWSSATNNINGDNDKLMPIKSWLPP
jgi:putative transposase